MPSSSQDFELARLLATLVAVAALLGSLASTAGNTHTAVANQLQLGSTNADSFVFVSIGDHSTIATFERSAGDGNIPYSRAFPRKYYN